MFSREEFEIYERSLKASDALSDYEDEVAARIRQFFERPVALASAAHYTDALRVSEELLHLVEDLGVKGLVLDRAIETFEAAGDAIDYLWRTVALTGCKVLQNGPITFVEDGCGQVWLFGERLEALPSASVAAGYERARRLEANRAVEASWRELLRAYAHVGPDDRSLTGIEGHDLVAEAVQRRLLDWEDASWWWPWRFPERLPAGNRSSTPEASFSLGDADA